MNETTPISLSIVIPCYNEAKNIPLLVARLKALAEGRDEVEIVLVDNGSTDDSAAVFATELAAAGGRFRVVTVPVNQGYGHGILSGLSAARGQVLSWTHADLQTDPADVLRAWELCREMGGTDVFIKGKRKNRRLLEAFFTAGMQWVALYALKTRLEDINAQPKLFSRSFYERFLRDGAPRDFSLDLYALYQAKRQGLRIGLIPVDFSLRLHGEAKGGGNWKSRMKLIRRTFGYIFELKRQLAAKSPGG